MIEHIYNIAMNMMGIIMMALIAKYIFLEPELQNYKKQFFAACLLLLILAEFMLHPDVGTILVVICAGIYIVLVRKTHKLRGFWLTLPIVGMGTGVIIPMLVIEGFLNRDIVTENMFYYIETTVEYGLLLLFWWKGKKWRQSFAQEMQYRALQKWESRLLTGIGTLLFLIAMPLTERQWLYALSFELKVYIAAFGMTSFMLTITVVVLIFQGNKRGYYHGLATLNEHYLKMELKHFEAYQKAQQETRRIRHDMKNHLHSIRYFVQERDFTELENYLDGMDIAMQQTDTELHCGSAFADAICNAKYQTARQKGISFQISGMIPDHMKMEPLDLCAVFANALDNAIEATEQLPDEQRWVTLDIAVQGNMLFLHFQNPTNSKPAIHGTTKPDRKNHGFGLQNIKLAVEKYDGEMEIHTVEKDGISIFSLEIMLICSR